MGLAGCTAIVPFGFVQTSDLEITRRTIPLPSLPSAFTGFTICHLSDLHLKEFGQNHKDLLAQIRRHKPNIIAMTGDMVDGGSKDERSFLSLCDQLPDIAPTYFVTGNHEMSGLHPGLAERVEKRGILFMDNRHTSIEHGGKTIYLAGAGESDHYGISGLEEAMRSIPDDGFVILLSHHPEHMADFVSHGANLVLSGHTHGGQVKLPFIGGIAVPDQDLFPPYLEGLYREGHTTMYISRGLGLSMYPVRINCPPELPFLTLQSA